MRTLRGRLARSLADCRKRIRTSCGASGFCVRSGTARCWSRRSRSRAIGRWPQRGRPRTLPNGHGSWLGSRAGPGQRGRASHAEAGACAEGVRSSAGVSCTAERPEDVPEGMMRWLQEPAWRPGREACELTGLSSDVVFRVAFRRAARAARVASHWPGICAEPDPIGKSRRSRAGRVDPSSSLIPEIQDAHEH
jgi:hypothetical protein